MSSPSPNRFATRLAGLLALPALLAPPLHAHGGTFLQPGKAGVTPGDTVPGPSAPGPGDTVPAGAATGAGGAGPAAARTPGRRASIPGATTPGYSPVAAPASVRTGGALPVLIDLTEWTWWWEFRKEPFLQTRRHVNADAPATGNENFFLGIGTDATRRDAIAPTEADVRARILPALFDALESEQSNDIVSGCLIALARIGDDLEGPPAAQIERAVLPHLASANQEVSETAVLALGILGRGSSALLLSGVLADREDGREALERGSVPERTRAFAAYGLGLLGSQTPNEDVRRYVVHELSRALERDESTPDVDVACVLAIGQVPLSPAGPNDEERRKRRSGEAPTASREAQVRFLLGLLDERRRDRLVLGHVPTALGELLAFESTGELLAFESNGELLAAESIGGFDPRLRDDVAQELLDRLRSRSTSREMAQSCVIALGRIAHGAESGVDARIRKTLLGIDTIIGDRQARNLAMIALARAAARPVPGQAGGTPSDGPDVERVREHLSERLGRGSSESRWAALAIALLERGRAETGRLPAESVGVAVAAGCNDARSPQNIGAYAISGGLLGMPGTEPELLSKLDEVREDRARGHAAIGLGLLGSRAGVEPARALLAEATYRPELLRELAIALALMGDPEATPKLVEMLEGASSLAAQASIAQALGKIGTRASVAPLIAHLQDGERTASSRAFAAVALGIVADRDELPWNTALSVSVNYAAATPTLFDHAGFGVLNIL